jgi:cytochrome c-type biogenesis protein CcmH/NrfG
MPNLKESALQDLQRLAADQHNNFADAAQYYLGLYYQSIGDSNKAVETWKKLATLNDTITDSMGRSPWATMAQAKISGLA